MNKLSEKNTTRLASLDILRGFDLFLLVFFQPVFAALVRQLQPVWHRWISFVALTCFFLSSFSRCLRRWYDS